MKLQKQKIQRRVRDRVWDQLVATVRWSIRNQAQMHIVGNMIINPVRNTIWNELR